MDAGRSSELPTQRRMRVLLTVGQTAGGIGRHVATVAESLAGNGVHVTVCGPDAVIATLGLVERPGLRLVGAPLHGRSVGSARAARRAIRREARDVDLIHAHGIQAGFYSAVAARNLPLIVTWHNAARGDARRIRRRRRLERVVAPRSALTLVVSGDLTERARAAGAARIEKCFVAAPAGAARSPASETRARLGAGSRPIVLAAARLAPQKRLDVLISSAASWGKDDNGPQVFIAGDGPLRPELQDHIHRLGAPVTLLGHRGDVADLLAAADLCAVSSEWEGCPLIVQEALRAGTPLVATAVGGIPELVDGAAVLVPPDDPEALRAAMEQILADRSLARRLADSGRRRAAQWPAVPDMVQGLLRNYEAVLSRSTTTPAVR